MDIISLYYFQELARELYFVNCICHIDLYNHETSC